MMYNDESLLCYYFLIFCATMSVALLTAMLNAIVCHYHTANMIFLYASSSAGL